MSDSLSQPTTIPYFIKYNPILIKEFGSKNAVLLFDRLEYWFLKKKNEFYKFIEPCEHPCYREGDSWSEELGFSKKVFRTAFDKIGIRYRSKTEFEKATNPFQGKLFAYYQDRQSKKTIFVRNNSLLAQLYARLKNLVEKTAESIGAKVKSSFKKGSPTADPLGSPHVRATKDKQINTSSKENDLKMERKFDNDSSITNQLDNTKTVSGMIQIWNEEVERKGVPSLSPSLETRMENALKDNFSNSLEEWRKHCITIASSAFLMGEKKNISYQIQLLVAMTSKFKTQLRDGKFELNTRESAHAKKIREAREKLKKLAVAKEIADNQISQKQDEFKSSQKKKNLAKVEELTEEERGVYQKDFEVEQKDCPFFQKDGWESRFVKNQFEFYLMKRVSESLGAIETEVATESLRAEKGIIEEKYDQVMGYLRELLACQENLVKNFSR